MITRGTWIWTDGENHHHKELVVKETLGHGVDSILYHGANWPMDEANARLIAAAPELLNACKAQHKAIDILFARLINEDVDFLPSKSGQPWKAIQEGNAAIEKAEKGEVK